MQPSIGVGPCRIIIASQPRLFREMLCHALQHAPTLHVVAQTGNLSMLPVLIATTGAQWVIVSLTRANALPPGLEMVWRLNPALQVLALAVDGSYAEWVCEHERWPNVSLDQLVQMLRSQASRRGSHPTIRAPCP